MLIEHKLLVSKREGNTAAGERLVALNAKGVTALGMVSTMPSGAVHARDFLRHAHPHRTACNSIYASQVGGKDTIDAAGWSEMEINARQDTVPDAIKKLMLWEWGNNGTLRKKPDVLLKKDGGLVWVEAENSYKSVEDFEKLVSFLRAIFTSKTPPVTHVLFVITGPGGRNIGERLYDALTHDDPKDGTTRQLKEIDARIHQDNRIHVQHLDADTLELISTDEFDKREEIAEALAAKKKHAKKIEAARLKTWPRVT